MNSQVAFEKAKEARKRGERSKVFDWDKAAQIIKERGAKDAFAGLQDDWDWTGGRILKDGKIAMNYTYLASVWATPELNIDGEYIECWKYEEDTPGWNCYTKWPESAVRILLEEEER